MFWNLVCNLSNEFIYSKLLQADSFCYITYSFDYMLLYFVHVTLIKYFVKKDCLLIICLYSIHNFIPYSYYSITQASLSKRDIDNILEDSLRAHLSYSIFVAQICCCFETWEGISIYFKLNNASARKILPAINTLT